MIPKCALGELVLFHHEEMHKLGKRKKKRIEMSKSENQTSNTCQSEKISTIRGSNLFDGHWINAQTGGAIKRIVFIVHLLIGLHSRDSII